MTMSIGSRVRNNTVKSASCNTSRRFAQSFAMPDGHIYGTDISFTAATSTISSAGAGLLNMVAGQLVRVRGSALNSREYQVVSNNGTDMVVLPGVLSDEAAGATIAMRKV